MSPQDRNQHWRRKWGLSAPEKECVVCGDPFPPQGSAVTCSPDCRAERAKQRNAKFRANHREELRERSRKEYHAAPERPRATQAAYREANRDWIAEKQRARRRGPTL